MNSPPSSSRRSLQRMPVRAGMTDVLVGRDAELTKLCELIKSDESAVALLSGEPGVGKTRLVNEALVRSGVDALTGTSSPASLGRPFDLLLSAVESSVRAWTTSPADLSAVRGALSQLLRSVAPALETVEAADGVAPSELIGAGIALLHHLDPSHLVLEDLHWADVESLQVLERLLSSPDQPTVVITYRPEELSAQHPAAQLLRVIEGRYGPLHIHLDPFGRAEVDEYVRLVLGDPFDDHLIEQLHARTGGSPLFLEEILAQSAGDPSQLSTPRLPWTLAETIRLALEEFDEDQRELLATAAVLGARFDFDLLQVAMGLDEAELIRRLRHVVDQRVLIEQDVDEFCFRHELVRESVLSSLLGRERRRLHDQAFRALEAHSPDDYAELARHAEGAQRLDDLVALAPKGVEHYLRAGSTYQALVLAEQALSEMPDHVVLCELAARAAWLTGKLDSASMHADHWRMIEARAGSGREAEALAVIGRIAYESGDTETELAIVAELTGRAQTAEETPERARILAWLAQHHMLNEHTGDAVALADEAIALAEQLGLDDVRRMAMVERGSALVCLSESVDEGQQMLESAAKESEAVGDYVVAARAWHNLSVGLPPEEMDCTLLAMRDAAQRGGFDSLAVHYFAMKKVELAVLRGDLHEALTWASRSRLLGRDSRTGSELALMRALLSLEAGSNDDAVALLDANEGRVLPHADGDPWGVAARAVLAARSDDLEGTREFLSRVKGSSMLPVIVAWAMRDLISVGVSTDELSALLATSDDQEDVPRGPVTALLAAAAGASDAQAVLTDTLEVGEAAIGLHKERAWVIPIRAELHLALAKLLLDQHDSEGVKQHACAAVELLSQWPGARRDDARALARRGRGDSSTDSSLTGRELDVAQLVARGMTNGQIAEQLYISRKTVSTHVSHILAKLSMSSRTEVAAWAIREGVAPA